MKRMNEFFIESIDIYLWGYILEGPFVPTHFFNNEVVNKPSNTWITKAKRKVQQGFKAKYCMISALSTREYNYVYNYCTSKEVQDTLEMIYEGSIEIKRENMNIIVQEVETPSDNEEKFQRQFSNIKTFENNFKNIVPNQYLRFKNWYSKSDSPFDFEDTKDVNKIRRRSSRSLKN